VRIDLTNLEDFIRGAAFLGTGGGGDPYMGRLMLQHQFQSGRSVTVLEPIELPDDARVVAVLTMGAPTVINEKVPSGAATVAALRRMEQQLDCKFDAIMPIEAGGINGTLPLVVGAMTGLPVVDVDGMGRAFPELQMTTFNVAGLSSSPNIVADDKQSIAIVETLQNIDAEWLCRSLCIRMGGECQLACYPMTGREAKDNGVLGTVSLSVEIGRVIRLARKEQSDPARALVDFFRSGRIGREARVLFDGKIVDLRRETQRGFSIGRVLMESLDGIGGTLEVEFQNEFLLAKRNGAAVAMVPDLICLVDRETAEPVTTENLKYGQRLKVLGVAVPPIMRSERALQVFGPAGFHLDTHYTPIEQLG
jgi:uncharacterized protein